jgi:AcrR family transcriptional regulator
MPRTKEQSEEMKKATVAKIKQAGLRLFATKGLAATSIADIAESAEISTGLLYHYYKSKEDLYAELVSAAITGANAAICDIADREVSPAEKIVLPVKGIREVMNEEFTVYFYVFMPQVLLHKSLPRRMQARLKDAFVTFDRLKEIIVEGQRSGEIKDGNPDAPAILFFRPSRACALTG